MPIVSVPGLGEIEFPDDMPVADIEKVLQQQLKIPAQDQSAQPAQPVQPQSIQMPADPMSESLAMFSPEAAGRGAQMYAPEIGATAGGLLGSKLPIPGATPFMTGIGYAGGEAIKAGEIPSLDQFTQNFGKGSAMEFGGQAAGWLTSKAFQPIKQGFQMLYAGKLAEKGLPVPAGAISPTEKGLTLAKKARETYPGNRIVQEAHDKLRQGADDLLTELSNKYNLYEHNPKAIADQAFDLWAENMGGNKASVQVETAIRKIREVLDDPIVINAAPKDKTAQWWKQQAASFADNPTLQGLRDIWSTITSRGSKGTDKTKRLELLDAIQQDLETNYGGDIVNLLNQARDKNAWAKKANILKTVIDKSMVKTESGLQFNPSVFSYEWKKAISSPKARHFSPDELADMSEFSGFMDVIGSELNQKVSSKGPESLLTGIGGAGLASYFGLPKTAALGLAAIQPGLSLRAGQMFKPESGLYRKMLGEPSATELIPGLVNIGGKLILLKGLPNE